MQVPSLDLKPQYNSIREEILGAVTEVLDSQYCVGGPKVAQLEKAVAEYCGSSYAVGVSSGLLSGCHVGSRANACRTASLTSRTSCCEASASDERDSIRPALGVEYAG